MDLVEADEEISLAVGSHNVTGGQDLEKAFAVPALDQVLLDDDKILDGRVHFHDLLRQLQVIVGLVEIVRQRVALIPATRLPRQQPILYAVFCVILSLD